MTMKSVTVKATVEVEIYVSTYAESASFETIKGQATREAGLIVRELISKRHGSRVTKDPVINVVMMGGER